MERRGRVRLGRRYERIDRGVLQRRLPLALFALGTNLGIRAIVATGEHGESDFMTEYHARYGGNGVMIYWHVEQKNVCIYPQLKSCSSSEVAAMIEGLLRHCRDTGIESNTSTPTARAWSGSPSPSCSTSACCRG